MQSYWDGSEWTGESRPKAFSAGSGAPSDTRNKGALSWVLLAIGLAIVGNLVRQSGATTLGWFLASGATVAWVLAAVNARSTIGKVILWVIVVVQVLGWVFLLV